MCYVALNIYQHATRQTCGPTFAGDVHTTKYDTLIAFLVCPHHLLDRYRCRCRFSSPLVYPLPLPLLPSLEQKEKSSKSGKEKKKKDKSTTSSSKKSGTTTASSAADVPPPAPSATAAAAAAAAAPMSVDVAQKKGKDVVAEFAVSGELEEACTCLKEIDAEVGLRHCCTRVRNILFCRFVLCTSRDESSSRSSCSSKRLRVFSEPSSSGGRRRTACSFLSYHARCFTLEVEACFDAATFCVKLSCCTSAFQFNHCTRMRMRPATATAVSRPPCG